MEPLNFDSHDVGEIEATVSRLYSRMHIGAVGESTRARITRTVLTAGVAFDDLDYSFDIGYSAEPHNQMIICDVLSNTIRRDGEQEGPETFGPGDQFLISRPNLPSSGLAHASRLRFTVLDPALLTRVASAMAEKPEPVRVLDHRPVSRAGAARLQRAITYVRENVLATPELQSTLVVSTASQYLAARALEAYPNTALAAPSTGDGRDATPTTVARAVAFIEANADADISLADIAAAASATPRAVQYGFRKDHDTTPMGYLRRVRLDAAHHALQTADPTTGQTVTTIAAAWGFAHPGRFAATYRQTYGETPSTTLHG
jgi:AraC-like DNA-binding protein